MLGKIRSKSHEFSLFKLLQGGIAFNLAAGPFAPCSAYAEDKEDRVKLLLREQSSSSVLPERIAVTHITKTHGCKQRPKKEPKLLDLYNKAPRRATLFPLRYLARELGWWKQNYCNEFNRATISRENVSQT